MEWAAFYTLEHEDEKQAMLQAEAEAKMRSKR
jgi:hypothetical protein